MLIDCSIIVFDFMHAQRWSGGGLVPEWLNDVNVFFNCFHSILWMSGGPVVVWCLSCSAMLHVFSIVFVGILDALHLVLPALAML